MIEQGYRHYQRRHANAIAFDHLNQLTLIIFLQIGFEIIREMLQYINVNLPHCTNLQSIHELLQIRRRLIFDIALDHCSNHPAELLIVQLIVTHNDELMPSMETNQPRKCHSAID